MTSALTLSEPIFSENDLNGTIHVEWHLLDDHGQGYLVSWLEETAYTHRTECMAFEAKADAIGIVYATDWDEKAVSRNPDAALALEEVVKQLEELYDVVVSVVDPASALRPGEVVSDAQ